MVVPSQPTATTLRSRYVEQAASDLAENRRQQQQLTEKIELLRQEETLLSDILILAERFEGSPDTAHIPRQAQNESAAAPGGATPRRKARVKVSGPRSKKSTTKAGTKTGAKTGAKGKPSHPLLGHIFMDLLAEHNEPRLAKELREELLEKHPDRRPTPQVVRNTLEALVAKGNIQRHKQQRSVMYSVVEPDAPTPAPAPSTPEPGTPEDSD
ncbi:hypothetical protein ACPXCE_00920 [Streptomyces sp. DT24]|uniref:hypothetical protein n=1 Tax=Streptomyces sp. DT24 TaxID=3416520 RepID=UPI003CF10FDE